MSPIRQNNLEDISALRNKDFEILRTSSDEEDRQDCASIIHEVVINDKNPFRK